MVNFYYNCINELLIFSDCLEGQLNSFLYNSPVGGILIVDISHSQRIHEFKCQLSKIKYKLKYLRKQFQENIAENMVKLYTLPKFSLPKFLTFFNEENQ